VQAVHWVTRLGSQKQGSGRWDLGLGALESSAMALVADWAVPAAPVVSREPLRGWCAWEGASSAHSTSEMCWTSFGREIGRFWMELDEGFFQWREVV